MYLNLIKTQLDILGEMTGIGFIFTSGSRIVSNSKYKNYGIDAFKQNPSMSSAYSSSIIGKELQYQVFYDVGSPKRLYTFRIGEVDGFEYSVESDITSDSLFISHRDMICSVIDVITGIFNLGEKLEQTIIANINTQHHQQAVKNGIVYRTPVNILRTIRTFHSKFTFAKLVILNTRDTLELYGIKALDYLSSEVLRTINAETDLLKLSNKIQEPLHFVDSTTFILVSSETDRPFREFLNSISNKLDTLTFNGTVIPVRLGISLVQYPKVLDADSIIRRLDIGIDSIENPVTLLTEVDMSNNTNNQALNNFYLSEELRNTINESKDDLIVMYQPKVDSVTKKIMGAEGLVRWNNSKQNRFIPPNEFIPLSERNGMIKEIGKIVLDKVIKDSLYLSEITGKAIRLGVNVSAIQLEDNNFVDYVVQLVQEGICNPYLLDFEITENVAMYDIKETVKKLNKFKELGITISLDDFGKGYSSLGYMKNLPLDTLKIDKTFVDTCCADITICDDIIEISRKLNLKTVAEGVETNEQSEILKNFGCDYLQGYHFYKPLKFEDLLNTIISGN